MKYRKLGKTNENVSLIGLGTMTWGEQNTEAEAHEQIDYALTQGINLIDVAEMYPVPPKPETQGRTESYIGTWFAKTGRRKDLFLATKIAGPSRQAGRPGHIRDGKTRHDLKNLNLAIDASLKRLQTDYVDLYQLHWPDRPAAVFGIREYPWADDPDTIPIEETLQGLVELVKSGKVRYVGVSNETPWGLSQFIKYADKLGLPRIVSIQNPYSLLNRLYEGGLSEFSHREEIGLLAYSPLAFGILTGKYLHGAIPPKSRLALFQRFGRYSKPQATEVVEHYVNLAKKHRITPAQLALAFVNSRPFVASNLIGATTLEQLKENISSIEITLSDEVIAEINEIHSRYPNPTP